jgi:hypothetical protein
VLIAEKIVPDCFFAIFYLLFRPALWRTEAHREAVLALEDSVLESKLYDILKSNEESKSLLKHIGLLLPPRQTDLRSPLRSPKKTEYGAMAEGLSSDENSFGSDDFADPSSGSMSASQRPRRSPFTTASGSGISARGAFPSAAWLQSATPKTPGSSSAAAEESTPPSQVTPTKSAGKSVGATNKSVTSQPGTAQNAEIAAIHAAAAGAELPSVEIMKKWGDVEFDAFIKGRYPKWNCDVRDALSLICKLNKNSDGFYGDFLALDKFCKEINSYDGTIPMQNAQALVIISSRRTINNRALEAIANIVMCRHFGIGFDTFPESDDEAIRLFCSEAETAAVPAAEAVDAAAGDLPSIEVMKKWKYQEIDTFIKKRYPEFDLKECDSVVTLFMLNKDFDELRKSLEILDKVRVLIVHYDRTGQSLREQIDTISSTCRDIPIIVIRAIAESMALKRIGIPLLSNLLDDDSIRLSYCLLNYSNQSELRVRLPNVSSPDMIVIPAYLTNYVRGLDKTMLEISRDEWLFWLDCRHALLGADEQVNGEIVVEITKTITTVIDALKRNDENLSSVLSSAYKNLLFHQLPNDLQAAVTNGSAVASTLIRLYEEKHRKATPDPALEQAISNAWKDFTAEKPILEAVKAAREAAEKAASE